MNIKLIGSKGNEKEIINKIVNDLNCSCSIEEVKEQDKDKYNIKHLPAIIIDNVVVSEDSKLSTNEIKNVIFQFIET